VNSTGIGSGGIEHDSTTSWPASRQADLRTGQRGGRIATAGGRITEPIDGNDLQLTIDRDIQWVAQRAIASQVRRHQRRTSGTGDRAGRAHRRDPGHGRAHLRPEQPRVPRRTRTGGNRAVSQVYDPARRQGHHHVRIAPTPVAATRDTKHPGARTLPRAGHVLHDDVNHGWDG